MRPEALACDRAFILLVQSLPNPAFLRPSAAFWLALLQPDGQRHGVSRASRLRHARDINQRHCRPASVRQCAPHGLGDFFMIDGTNPATGA